MTWLGSRGTKCPKCKGGVCSERGCARACALCDFHWSVPHDFPARLGMPYVECRTCGVREYPGGFVAEGHSVTIPRYQGGVYHCVAPLNLPPAAAPSCWVVSPGKAHCRVCFWTIFGLGHPTFPCPGCAHKQATATP